MVHFTSISLCFFHIPFHNRLEIGGRGEQCDARNVPECLQAEGPLIAKAGTWRRCLWPCDGSGQIGGLLIVWEPARCSEMVEFGNGSDVLQIRAQKYVEEWLAGPPGSATPLLCF